jgi:hypothetical protein
MEPARRTPRCLASADAPARRLVFTTAVQESSHPTGQVARRGVGAVPRAPGRRPSPLPARAAAAQGASCGSLPPATAAPRSRPAGCCCGGGAHKAPVYQQHGRMPHCYCSNRVTASAHTCTPHAETGNETERDSINRRHELVAGTTAAAGSGGRAFLTRSTTSSCGAFVSMTTFACLRRSSMLIWLRAVLRQCTLASPSSRTTAQHSTTAASAAGAPLELCLCVLARELVALHEPVDGHVSGHLRHPHLARGNAEDAPAQRRQD